MTTPPPSDGGYELLHICEAAPGWNAVFREAGRFVTRPVAAWAFAHDHSKDALDDSLMGLTYNARVLVLADTINDFQGYSQPGDSVEEWWSRMVEMRPFKPGELERGTPETNVGLLTAYMAHAQAQGRTATADAVTELFGRVRTIELRDVGRDHRAKRLLPNGTSLRPEEEVDDSTDDDRRAMVDFNIGRAYPLDDGSAGYPHPAPTVYVDEHGEPLWGHRTEFKVLELTPCPPGWQAVSYSRCTLWSRPIACWALCEKTVIGSRVDPVTREHVYKTLEVTRVTVGFVTDGLLMPIAEKLGIAGYCPPGMTLEEWGRRQNLRRPYEGTALLRGAPETLVPLLHAYLAWSATHRWMPSPKAVKEFVAAIADIDRRDVARRSGTAATSSTKP